MSRASTPASNERSGLYQGPTQVGPYEVHARIGTGSTAFTFVASEPGPGGGARLKCLKLPSPQLLAELSPRQIRKIFWDEADVLGRLPPTNIAALERAVDLPDDQGVVVLVYPYIHGLNLKQLIQQHYARRELLPWPAVIAIARDIATALDEAHTDRRGQLTPFDHASIVHRDISPSNVMVDSSGNAFLIDFGFARAMETAVLQPSRHHIGRVAYAAPEYGRGGEYGPSLDLFSTGAVLFEALTGRPPYPHDESIHEHIERVWRRDRPTLHALHPRLRHDDRPSELVAFASIVECLLAPDPGDRFQSAGALLSALTSLHAGNDKRRLGAIVESHQNPWQLRLTEGRIDRAEVQAQIRAAQQPWFAKDDQTPEEVLVEKDTLDELGVLEATANLLPPTQFADTHPEQPVIPVTQPSADAEPQTPFPATNPSQPTGMVRKQRSSGVRAIVPATNPSAPPSEPPTSSTPPLAATMPLGSPTPAPGSSNPPSRHPFTVAQRWPAIPEPSAPTDPPEQPVSRVEGYDSYVRIVPTTASRPVEGAPGQRELRAQMGLALIAIATLLVTSLFVLGTLNTLWVPLLTGQLGWTIIDSFWTPLLTKLCAAGCVIALVSAVGLLVIWLRSHSKSP